LLLFFLPVLLFAATRWASATFAPPTPERVLGREEAGGEILVAEGPVVFATRPSKVWTFRGAVFLSEEGVRPALLPTGVHPTALRLEDLTGDGRLEIFVTSERAADTDAPRRVIESGFAYLPDPGAVASGELVPFLTFDLLVDAKRSDSTPWEEIATYTPDDAPVGAFPDLVVSRTKNVYRPGARFSPATLLSSTTLPPLRLTFDPSERRYRMPEGSGTSS
jgi:hypothetical protein